MFTWCAPAASSPTRPVMLTTLLLLPLLAGPALASPISPACQFYLTRGYLPAWCQNTALAAARADTSALATLLQAGALDSFLSSPAAHPTPAPALVLPAPQPAFPAPSAVSTRANLSSLASAGLAAGGGLAAGAGLHYLYSNFLARPRPTPRPAAFYQHPAYRPQYQYQPYALQQPSYYNKFQLQPANYQQAYQEPAYQQPAYQQQAGLPTYYRPPRPAQTQDNWANNYGYGPNQLLSGQQHPAGQQEGEVGEQESGEMEEEMNKAHLALTRHVCRSHVCHG